MPDKGSAERVSGTFNEPGFPPRQLTCPFLVPGFPHSSLPGQGPEPQARGQWQVTVALLTGSCHRTRGNKLKGLVPRGQRAPTQEPSSPFPFQSRYPLFMLGSALRRNTSGISYDEVSPVRQETC